MYQNNPNMSVIQFASGFTNTSGTVTTLTTSTTVPAGTLVVFPLLFAANSGSAGIITLSSSFFTTRTYSNFVSATGAAACHGILVFVQDVTIPAGSSISWTRNATWPLGDCTGFMIPGCTNLQNFASVGGPLSANTPYGINSSFTGGTVVTPGWRKTNATFVLMSSPGNNQLAAVGGGGLPGYGPIGNRPSFTVTSIADTATLETSVPHGLLPGQVITMFSANTNGITGSNNQRYYVLSSGLTATQFRIALTYNGTIINTLVSGAVSLTWYIGENSYFVGGGGTGFAYARVTAIFPYYDGGNNQQFIFQTNATTGGTWAITAYRFVCA